MNTGSYNLIISVVIAIIIVLSMNLVGLLMISAFIIIASILAGRPVGSTIVAVDALAFGICLAINEFGNAS